MENTPAISVVIPMYNAEKYIGECLESLLVQTFKNYEVILVDDCSTDNSVAVVKTYIPKFGGRLKVYSTEMNSDTSGSAPRNKGLMLSIGEYVTFVDADDFLTRTALEEMYKLAKDFDSEVVYCEKCYKVNSDKTNPRVETEQHGDFVDKPTFETENFEERVRKLLQTKFWVSPVSKLVKREFLLEHEIFFAALRPREDDIWNYHLIFYAKKILRVPNIVYIVRESEDSVTRKKRTPLQNLNFWLSPIFEGLKIIDNLMKKFEFFNRKPEYRYAVLEYFCQRCSTAILGYSFPFPPVAVYESIKQEFGGRLGEKDVLVSTLCTIINTQQKILMTNQQKFNQFAAQSQQRIAELEAQLKK
ncbi:MAG: glycosyltransferase [Selenomonadaceae bacterium]|nr:glycosyltransferase [Selenomonadaceae bacterium]